MNLSGDEVADLLRWRCQQLGYLEPIDTAAIHESCSECCKILRFLFTRYSAAVSAYLTDNDHAFDDNFTDRQLVDAILSAWPLVSSQQLGDGSVTADRLMANDWNHSLLLFTLQATRTCFDMHSVLEGAQPRRSPSPPRHAPNIEGRLETIEELLRHIQMQQPGSAAQFGSVRIAQVADLRSSWLSEMSEVSEESAGAREEPPLAEIDDNSNTLQRMIECYREVLGDLAPPRVGGSTSSDVSTSEREYDGAALTGVTVADDPTSPGRGRI
jgi:hypothetical protein